MANTIKIKNSGTTSNVPSSLEHGELAINYADGLLFYKNSSNVISQFSSGGGASVTISDTAPSSPSAGDLWYESDTGDFFVYYDSYWVELGADPPSSSFLSDLDGDTLIQVEESNDEDKIRFDTAGSERMVIDASGNVGINDTTPSYKLDVDGDINATGDVRVAGAPVGKVLVYEGTVGSGVSSFTASNVFSSAYDNYEVIVNGMDCSVDGIVLGLRLGSSTTNYSYGGYYIIYSTGASGFFSSTTETSWGVGYTDTRGVTGFVAQILCPNLAIRTKFTSVSPGNNVQRSVAGEHSSNTAHTSFTLLPSSGTMTGGVVRVYGHVEA